MTVSRVRRLAAWLSPGALRRRAARLGFARPRIVRRFRRDDKGATAIEFAFVVGPFLFLIFATIEVAMVFFASQLLETATADTARLILTGQAQTANFDKTAFKNAVCDKVKVLMSCANINIDVQTAASFSAANTSSPARTSTGAVNYSSMSYNQGAGGDIVVVKVFYEWPVLMPTFGLSVGDLPNGKRLIMSTAAFRNEPFSTSSGS
ncbi:MAG: pilus assembly protein [Rhizobiales bacterium]|nr:pilus assembly protein [Hyphomicrobiales bacterium]